jgi:hypothetical protein
MSEELQATREFFGARGDWVVKIENYGIAESVTVEELYQHFQRRVILDMIDHAAKRDQ